MSTDESNGAASDARSRGRFFTRRLRRASFISPLTGERSARSFTLREASHRGAEASGHHDNERTPLLRQDAGNDHGGRQPMRIDAVWEWCCIQARTFRDFANSKTGLNILKCSLAYFLGSLATFVPAIHQFIGHRQDSKHMVATVTVWFHPARTMGSMHEATVLALIALFYSGFVSFTSMGLSMFFATRKMIVIGHLLVLVFFVGGGLGFIAWVKQRLNHPLVNMAAALASLGCITVLIKEGTVQAGSFSVERVLQVLLMVAMGVLITTLVNILVLPVTARNQLALDLEKNTDLLGEMLISITRAFLSGREGDMLNDSYKKLTDDLSASTNSMQKNLIEAKREQLVIGKEGLWHAQARIVECLMGLSQDLGGLRSAALAQFAIINETPTPDSADGVTSPEAIRHLSPAREHAKQPNALGVISEAPEEHDRMHDWSLQSSAILDDSAATSPKPDRARRESLESNQGVLKSPSDMFLAFLHQLGPPSKSLVYTVKQIMDELPFKTGTSPKTTWRDWLVRPSPKVAFSENFRTSLQQALELYRQSRKDALETLYQNRAINAALTARQPSRPTFVRRNSFSHSGVATPGENIVADVEEVSACCGHFSFSLLDFAEDVMDYLTILEDLKTEMETPSYSWTWLIPKLSWMGLRQTDSIRLVKSTSYHVHDEEYQPAHGIPSPVQKADNFANPDKASIPRPWTYRLYKFSRIFNRDDVIFALKVGIGALIYALPAFIAETRPFFVTWRGEWGLVSYMAICCMTIGASNTTGVNRIIGTFIGAICAVIAWVTSSHEGECNPFILAFWGWVVSVGCFYIMLAKNNGPMARFILLTYNLGALYSYSLSIQDDDNDDDEGGIDPAIWDIVAHRVVAVVVGCIWGIIVTRFIWPISARTKLQHGMSLLWLRMSLIWKRDPLALLLLGEPRSRYMDIREEASLQSFLSNLDGLRKAAQSEFELKGPFPDSQIRRAIEHTQRMLDAFHAMNVAISKNLQYTPGEAAVLRYTRPERFELSARISHLFSVLASSVRLEYPLNDVLPSIDHTRDRLLARLSEFRRSGDGREVTTEQDYELLYAYVLVTGQISQEIHGAFLEIEALFGTLNEENFKLD